MNTTAFSFSLPIFFLVYFPSIGFFGSLLWLISKFTLTDAHQTSQATVSELVDGAKWVFSYPDGHNQRWLILTPAIFPQKGEVTKWRFLCLHLFRTVSSYRGKKKKNNTCYREVKGEKKTTFSSVFINLFPGNYRVTGNKWLYRNRNCTGNHLGCSDQTNLSTGHLDGVSLGGSGISLSCF